MEQFRFKKPYAISQRLQFLLELSFYLLLIGIFVELAVAIFLPAGTFYRFDSGFLVFIVFTLIFLLALALLSANFILWIGMLDFLTRYDGRSTFIRTIWFLITFFGLSWGAALYYFFVYRKFLSRLQHSMTYSVESPS